MLSKKYRRDVFVSLPTRNWIGEKKRRGNERATGRIATARIIIAGAAPRAGSGGIAGRLRLRAPNVE